MPSVLITGCSDGGIGAALAHAFHSAGLEVFATARSIQKMTSLADIPGITLLKLDVTDPKSISLAVDAVTAATADAGGLDYLVNNAGQGYVMPMLDSPVADLQAMFDINVWGALRVTQAFAPLVVRAKGVIVNNRGYSASKAALDFVSTNLKLELAPFGVRVVLLRTGNIATNWFDSVPTCKLPRESLYQPVETQITKMAQGKHQFPTMDPNEYARRVVRDVLAATHSTVIWRGAQASTVKWAVAWMPLWILMHFRNFFLLPLGLALACSSDEDCSLNGVCDNTHTNNTKTCLCDPGWIGSDCGVLDLRPATKNTGYNRTAEGISSWGATILRDPSHQPDVFHLIHAQFAFGCDLDYWTPYSVIAHSISTTGPEGPYHFRAQLVDTFAHNPTVIYSAADAAYVLVHIGCPVNVSTTSCETVQFSCGTGNTNNGESGISAWTSRDLDTWQFHGQVMPGNGNGTWDADTTNPSIFPLHADGHNMLMAYRGCVENCGEALEQIGVASAPSFTGPYTRLPGPVFPENTEDPHIWRDKRGNWHMLVHSLEAGGGFGAGPKVGRHAYAREWDGEWTFNNSTLAYSTHVEFTDGSAIDFSRRERPQILFSEDGLMRPLFLSNGVQEANSSLSYTIVQPIGST
ncbi:Reelin [Talaromyces islandicus]|uniref:Reelin n=1 Tax=Talaromyces islandicus TaxID=28573 RepID=A0A0U1LZD6_TALIS|nr:Reelin [Talaromyces islandicus]